MSSSGKRPRWRKWLASYSAVSSWLGDLDLEAQLQQHGGLVKLTDFLPPFVADGILELLEGLPAEEWNVTAAGDDYTANNIRHQFLSTKSDACADVFRLFTLLLPESLWTFSAAKYECASHIVPHDDRAYTQVRMEDGRLQLCSRRIALIYYLTRDWAPADGGALVDHEAPGGPEAHVPGFNSLVAFTIPRWHEVTPVTAARPRYSIFGWFLEPGKLYGLNTAPQPAAGQQAPQQQQQQLEAEQAPAAGRKKKRRKQHLLEQQAPQPAGQQQPPQQQTPAAGHKKKRRKQQLLQQPGQSPSVVPALQQHHQQHQQQQQQQQQQRKKKRKQQQPAVLTAPPPVAAQQAPPPPCKKQQHQHQQQPSSKKKKKHKQRLAPVA